MNLNGGKRKHRSKSKNAKALKVRKSVQATEVHETTETTRTHETRLSSDIYQQKANLICKLYALKLRMASLRALVVRYNFPYTEETWPMLAQSVALHSFMMAQLIGPLYQEFLSFFQSKNISIWQLESEALHHDDAEALTGDAATDVDGITRAMKDAAEAKSIDRQYQDMVCQFFLRLQHENYEAKDSYSSKIVKMMDALELILFSQDCVRNGVGMIQRSQKSKEFVLLAFGKERPVDRRTYGEITPYIEKDGLIEVPISKIMYDHSLPRLEKLGCPELIDLFKLICECAFEFPFEEYNLVNLPMDFAGMA